MRKILAAALVTAATMVAGPALARDGCGPDRFRSSLFGHCHWAGPPPGAGYYGPGPAYRGRPDYGYGYRNGPRGYGYGYRYQDRRPPAYDGWRY